MFPSAAKANQNVFRGKDGANLTVAQLYVKLTGATIADADAGKVAPASLGQAPEPVTAADVLLQAQMGAVAMTSSLMTALFGLQEDKG